MLCLLSKAVVPLSDTEELLDAELRPFLNEPPGARQVALDRPSGLEYLLTIELLRPKLKDVFRDLADLEADLILRPSAASKLNFRVDGNKLAPGIFDFHLPIDAPLSLVDIL